MGIDGLPPISGVARDTRAGESMKDAVAVDPPQDVEMVIDHDQFTCLHPSNDAQRPTGVGLARWNTLPYPHAGDGRYRARPLIRKHVYQIHDGGRLPHSGGLVNHNPAATILAAEPDCRFPIRNSTGNDLC